jgi:hypothetical protein
MTEEEWDAKWRDSKRLERRKSLEKELAHFRANLPKGWREVKSKNFFCFTHADEKYTRRVLDQAEGMRAWAEKTFGSLGTGEISPLVIRICENGTEEGSFRATTGGMGRFSWGGGIHYTTNQERIGGDLYALGDMNSWILYNYIEDRNADVSWAVPSWMRSGLWGLTTTGVLAKGRFDFRPGGSELADVRMAVKARTLLGARDILEGNEEAFAKVQGDYYQCAAFARFLMDGPGATDKRTKGKILEILRVSGEIRREERLKDREDSKARAEAGEAEKRPETEEEEEAMAKARSEKWKAEEREYRRKVLERAFPGWTDADWTSLDRTWRAFAAQYE